MAFAYYQQGSTPVYYFYETNIQGDIVNVYNENGVRVLGYRYDAYGITSTDKYNTAICTDTFLQAVLFAYRGYIYDSETALYYLQSRYYAPDICRFINADNSDVITASPMALTDKNLYAYCDNNPIMRADNGGEFWHIVGGAVIGAAIGAISSIVAQAISRQEINWAEVGISAATGALTGAISAACPGMGALATGLVQGVIGAGTYAATEAVNGRTPTLEGVLAAGVTSGVLAGGTKAIGNLVTKIKTPNSNPGVPFRGTG